MRRKSQWEFDWYRLGLPYYRIYPSILRLFLGINLNVPCDSIRPPLCSLAIQLPDGKLCGGDWTVHNLLVHIDPEKGQMGAIAYGQCHDVDLAQSMVFPMTQESVEEQIMSSKTTPTVPSGMPEVGLMSHVMACKCMRIVATLCLIAGNPEFVRPEVLVRDEEKYDRTRDDSYVKKAKGRGKYGWTVGKHIEMSPHFRNGCLAIYWTGEGRTIRTIRWRKESIVHKKVVQSVPQGCMALATE